MLHSQLLLYRFQRPLFWGFQQSTYMDKRVWKNGRKHKTYITSQNIEECSSSQIASWIIQAEAQNSINYCLGHPESTKL
jgi:hypothetical protein